MKSLEPICKTRVHCGACRNDAAWRASLKSAGYVEDVDFACPHGITALAAFSIQALALSEITGSNKPLTDGFKRLAAECGGCNRKPEDDGDDMEANNPL